jgi:hypothetical protein
MNLELETIRNFVYSLTEYTHNSLDLQQVKEIAFHGLMQGIVFSLFSAILLAFLSSRQTKQVNPVKLRRELKTLTDDELQVAANILNEEIVARWEKDKELTPRSN